MLLTLLVRLLGERWAFLEEVAMDEVGSGEPWIFDGIHRSQETQTERGGSFLYLSNFNPRRNMCKAEEAEYYITAADRHWRTDGELRAVAEVHQIISTLLYTSHANPKLQHFVENENQFLEEVAAAWTKLMNIDR